jgi:hypothetical protein
MGSRSVDAGIPIQEYLYRNTYTGSHVKVHVFQLSFRMSWTGLAGGRLYGVMYRCERILYTPAQVLDASLLNYMPVPVFPPPRCATRLKDLASGQKQPHILKCILRPTKRAAFNSFLNIFSAASWQPMLWVE